MALGDESAAVHVHLPHEPFVCDVREAEHPQKVGLVETALKLTTPTLLTLDGIGERSVGRLGRKIRPLATVLSKLSFDGGGHRREVIDPQRAHKVPG